MLSLTPHVYYKVYVNLAVGFVTRGCLLIGLLEAVPSGSVTYSRRKMHEEVFLNFNTEIFRC